jgi:hypothetical protein
MIDATSVATRVDVEYKNRRREFVKSPGIGFERGLDFVSGGRSWPFRTARLRV